jgi:hypothetical protein
MSVRLQYAGLSAGRAYARVKVLNLGFTKHVAVQDRDRPRWSDSELVWTESYGDHDVFGTPGPIGLGSVGHFAVRYSTRGATYWDDNGGATYALAEGTGVVGGDVTLRQATTVQAVLSHQRSVTGTLYVNNLGPRKNVGVRLSADGGRTWQDYAARYEGPVTEGSAGGARPLDGVEQWEFATPPLAPTGPAFLFSAYYDDHWDTNFGRNYALRTLPGATIG